MMFKTEIKADDVMVTMKPPEESRSIYTRKATLYWEVNPKFRNWGLESIKPKFHRLHLEYWCEVDGEDGQLDKEDMEADIDLKGQGWTVELELAETFGWEIVIHNIYINMKDKILTVQFV